MLQMQRDETFQGEYLQMVNFASCKMFTFISVLDNGSEKSRNPEYRRDRLPDSATRKRLTDKKWMNRLC
jgi:hypothetical protein